VRSGKSERDGEGIWMPPIKERDILHSGLEL